MILLKNLEVAWIPRNLFRLKNTDKHSNECFIFLFHNGMAMSSLISYVLIIPEINILF